MIEISDINYRYGRQKNLFSNLNYSEKAGNIVGLLGKNGSGKSTLFKIISGLLSVKSGSVTTMGTEPFHRKPSFLNQLYFVPEEYHLPSISIKHYVKAYSGLYPGFDAELLHQILADFELKETMKLSRISYGQKKKFLIAFALATNCKLLLFDEPTNGLDIPSKAIFRKVVASSVKDDQLIIISTHQVRDIENLIDKIVVIDNGKIIFNREIYQISERYAFSTVSSISDKNPLYTEVGPAGHRVILPLNGSSTPVDIELLFNAIVKGVIL
ncbi:ABC transporter ATP-binding protein [Alkalitalea saponilacus]|uniref:ABC-2 type transport system ATP-binding protein n=1 Tax=Alkalitalea saponilacus TaxID=889453 RepID=A0A1T5EHC7_9BACT|nr:ABC transporter ATP-binding protein [Alkalitalea saponilacus]ASB48979.1 ABC transporter ATP-binding protein [Alkalitalea saponilacus]SKB83422.1 ABC-2 type transport system ATP-binding protein [Alkalitalea saponilacus]